MKKFIYIAALLIGAALTLTACGGDDEPKEDVTATATYQMTFSQDLLDACNVFITYKAENGRNVMEAVRETWWTKTVTSDKFPAEFGVMYKFSTRSDAELTQETTPRKAKQIEQPTTEDTSEETQYTIHDEAVAATFH